MRPVLRLLQTAAIGATFVAAAAAAQTASTGSAQPYPNKPVRVVVPYAAGGLPDTITRLVATRLTETLKQQFVIDNRPGAGGIGACELVARATADGYTLLVADVGQTAINPALYAKLPYDPAKDFAPVSILGTSRHSSSPRTRRCLQIRARN